ncbi:sugar kinase [Allorhizobium sp. BGMRC 0089]|uniref:sugar kinase n=1 Tax=Allorhizobium sonneratiae TaxID=2934936 RepID=UPI0020343720|nr:sugar kinase [Allorhizobium sonneratiae]MCM2290748.1 sugar kinase [Allorhizobium sonneratiae]
MTGKRILAIGECMVEMAPRDDGAFSRNFAGDSFNTAWYLRRILPQPDTVDYCSAIGTDAISETMADFIAKAGIGTDFIRRIGDRTVGLYMIELKDGERSFSYWRGQSAAKLLAAEPDFLEEAVKDRDLIHFSGITLAILSEEHRPVLMDALQKARAAGAVIAFDPNMRARLWPDGDTMRNAVMAAAAVADIVLPSFDEDGPVFGDVDPVATIARYRDAGATTVVVKNGAGRIHAFEAGEGGVTFDPVPVATVVDSTAAGDSFNAAFLAARLQGEVMAVSLANGAALSARVIGSRGALVEL